jgi:hypothetical protein
MLDDSSDEREMGRRAMRTAMAVMELPLMAFVGYLVGRSVEREFEGAAIGVALGVILLIASVWPMLRNRRQT